LYSWGPSLVNADDNSKENASKDANDTKASLNENISKNVKLTTRIKNVSYTLLPLIFSSIDKIDVSKLDETIGATEDYNVFRKDEVKQFDNIEQMMENGPEVDRNMFKIPKVL